jgi:hypothetical protein
MSANFTQRCVSHRIRVVYFVPSLSARQRGRPTDGVILRGSRALFSERRGKPCNSGCPANLMRLGSHRTMHPYSSPTPIPDAVDQEGYLFTVSGLRSLSVSSKIAVVQVIQRTSTRIKIVKYRARPETPEWAKTFNKSCTLFRMLLAAGR